MKFNRSAICGKVVITDGYKQTRRFDSSDEFLNAPYFNFNDDKLKFNTNDVDNPNENYGAASAFLPSVSPVCD